MTSSDAGVEYCCR